MYVILWIFFCYQYNGPIMSALISAIVKASVDGAANILYNTPALDHESYIPDIITGDFDSVLPPILEHYKEKVIISVC